jgi:hypothetical protein
MGLCLEVREFVRDGRGRLIIRRVGWRRTARNHLNGTRGQRASKGQYICRCVLDGAREASQHAWTSEVRVTTAFSREDPAIELTWSTQAVSPGTPTANTTCLSLSLE